jgi:hypothetical protein
MRILPGTLLLAVGVLAVPPTAGATTATANGAACFGGAPQVAVSDQPRATELRVHGNQLYWAAGGELRSADLATGRVAALGGVHEVRAMDARWVASIVANNRLWILDRRTKKTRMLVDGFDEMENQFVTSSVGLHGGHVYFGRTAPDFRADDGGFFRVAIAGNHPPERLAAAPNANTPFVIAGGAVLWLDVAADAFVLHRRPVGSRGGPREETRPLPGSRPLASNDDAEIHVLRLEGDQLWFAAANGIWSAPLDGRGPARERVPNAWGAVDDDLDQPRELLAQGPCVYWATMHALRRARIDGAVEPRPETLAAENQFWETSLATDGRYLYWASRDGRILRSGRK